MNFLNTTSNNATNKKDSIDEILIKSQRLVHLTNHPTIVSKGITELTDSSKQWKTQDVANNNSNISIHNHSEAYRLLSQKNFDAKKLNEDLNSINVKTIDDSSTLRLEGTDIEGYLCHQHDMIILATIEDSRLSAEEHMQEMQRRWATAEWSHARAQFMDTIGHKVHQWEGSVSAKLPVSVGIFSPSSTPGMSAKLSRTPGFPSQGHGLHDKAPLSPLMQIHSAIVRDLNILSHTQTNKLISLSNPVSVLNDHSIQKDSRTLKPYTQLADSIKIPHQGIATSLVSDGVNLADLIAYQSHLYLLAHAVGEYAAQSGVTPTTSSYHSTSTVPGYFSPICFDSADIAQASQSHAFHTVEERRKVLSQGTKKFLEVQIAEKWREVLDEALHTGDWNVLSSSEGNSRQQHLKSYVAYLYHTKQLPEQCGSVLSPLNQLSAQQQSSSTSSLPPGTPYLTNTSSSSAMPSGYTMSLHSHSQKIIEVPLWVYIYHCLRSGNLAMIETELTCCVSEGYSNGEFAVLKILQTCFKLNSADAMTSSTNVRTKTANKSNILDENEIRLLVEQIESCRSFYDHEMNRNNGDPYKSLILNLFSLADKESLASAAIPGFSIEDFMWCNVWMIDHMRTLQPYINNRINLPVSISERGLFELILDYGGSDYFDEDRTNPFRYAMVLSCCQRYGDAIAHLWQCNKVFPAVHLTIVALYYGLILPHIPLSMNPVIPIGTYRNIYTHTDPSPVTILKAFIGTPLLENYPEIVVDYLVSLDSNWMSYSPALEGGDLKDIMKAKCQHVISMVFQEYICKCNREQLDIIVGRPVTQPSHTASLYRSPGARIDDYFITTQVETLLSTCAYYLLTSRKEIEASIYLYQLAGKYTEVLEELCAQLTNVFLPYPGTVSNPMDKIDRYRLNTEAQHIQNYQQTRSKWLSFCEYFLLNFRMVLDNYHSLVNALQVLMHLLTFADAFSTSLVADQQKDRMTPKEIYSILDDLQIIPNNEQQIDTFNQYNNKYIRLLMDDILLMAMDCTVTDYKMTLQDRMKSSTAFNSSILTEQDIYLQLLKHRAHMITSFAFKIKTRLNRSDTTSILSNIESSAFIM